MDKMVEAIAGTVHSQKNFWPRVAGLEDHPTWASTFLDSGHNLLDRSVSPRSNQISFFLINFRNLRMGAKGGRSVFTQELRRHRPFLNRKPLPPSFFQPHGMASNDPIARIPFNKSSSDSRNPTQQKALLYLGYRSKSSAGSPMVQSAPPGGIKGKVLCRQKTV
jgi:hypothetical protein